MHDFLKLHHNWDAFMGVQKERKITFVTEFEQREKEARSLFAAQYWYRSCLWMSLLSESSVSNTIPRYLYWSTEFTYWPPNFKTGVAVLLALLALNVIQTVLLQLKIIQLKKYCSWKNNFNPNVFVFLKRNRFLFFYKKNKDPILNCFHCIMQYHHFQNYIIMTCYTFYYIQIWGWRNVPHLCLIHFKVIRLGKNAQSKQRKPLPHKLCSFASSLCTCPAFSASI